MSLFKMSLCAVALATLMPADTAKAGDNPFLADIMIVGFNFCPRGWAKADGQILPINTNQSLFSLLGTTYGGDGRTSFALPDLRGRYALNFGTAPNVQTTLQGARGGQEYVTMSEANMASHTHVLTGDPTAHVQASTTGPNTNSPAGASLATFPAGGNSIYTQTQAAPAVMGNGSVKLTTTSVVITNQGNSQPLVNIQPTMALTVCIAIQGLFPSRN